MADVHSPSSERPCREGSSGAPVARRRRLVGVDAARGLALIGMISVHILPSWDAETFEATLQWQLSFTSGGRTPHRGRPASADRVGLLVRAVLITVLGLLVNQVMPADPPAYNILVYYGMFFLLTIPFLHLGVRPLFFLAAGFAVLGPVLMQALRPVLPAMETYNPTLGGVVADPGTVLAQVLLTGTYPALPYLAYLLAGLAIGRLDLRSVRVQGRLLWTGLLLAVGAWLVYWVLVVQGGGWGQLIGATPGLTSEGLTDIVVWGPNPELPTTTWWWLLIPGPHTNTPIAVLQDLGGGAAVLGLFLLLTRRSGEWLLPLRAMGSMTLTLYTAHLLGLAPLLHYDLPVLWFLVHVLVAAVFATVWYRVRGRGPLEQIVARSAGGARRLVLGGRRD
jgi:uncharacterized membrane protein YeiB